MGLKIPAAADVEFDLLALGECMIRLSPPGHQRIELTPVFEAYAGGGEYNVAYALARYGMRTGWVSRLVDNPLGHFIQNHALASGMDISEVVWVSYDGSGRADRIGLTAAAQQLGITPYQALTVASMVEEEAKLPGDRGKVIVLFATGLAPRLDEVRLDLAIYVNHLICPVKCGCDQMPLTIVDLAFRDSKMGARPDFHAHTAPPVI